MPASACNYSFHTFPTACGGFLRASYQVQQFYSHATFGHLMYDDDMDCEWTIEAPPNRNVQLIFLTFDIESSENCTYDYVQVVSNMEDTSGPMYGQYCGNLVNKTFLIGNKLKNSKDSF